MSVSSVSSSSSLTQTDWRSVMNQWKQDFKQLASALQTGTSPEPRRHSGATTASTEQSIRRPVRQWAASGFKRQPDPKRFRSSWQSPQLRRPERRAERLLPVADRHAGGWPERRIRGRPVRASWASSSSARLQRVGFRQQYGRPNALHRQRWFSKRIHGQHSQHLRLSIRIPVEQSIVPAVIPRTYQRSTASISAPVARQTLWDNAGC